MAIEFECPSCSATIRVPDAYGGRQGRCPGCNERLLVPAVPMQSGTAAGGATPAIPSAIPGTPAALGAFPLPLADRKPTTAVKARRSRRRPSRALVVGIPVIGFLLLMGIIAYSVTGSLPDLNGKLSATFLTGKSLPRNVIPWSDTGLGQEDRDLLAAAMIESPERLASDLMSCQLIGSQDGLEILLTAPTGSKWCAVETAGGGQKALQLWRKRERARWNAERRTQFLQALKNYCNGKLRQIRGEKTVIDGVTARDSVALASRLDAFGFAIEGRIGNRIIRPAGESEAGMIYFCVPEETISFTIQGRTLPNGQKMFPGEYVVNLAAASATAEESDALEESTGPTPAGGMDGSGAEEITPVSGAMPKSDGIKSGDAPTDPPASGSPANEMMTTPDGAMMKNESETSGQKTMGGFAEEEDAQVGGMSEKGKKKPDMSKN
jgi:hypothetical protein